MIRQSLTQWLAAVYSLPVVEDFDETKVERSIMYDLTTDSISVRIQSDESIKFEFAFEIVYRCPNGFPGIGFLTLGLIDKDKRPPGFNIVSADANERVSYETKTEMVITKPVVGFMIIERDRVRELIKCVEFADGLNCVESCITGVPNE